MALGAVSARTDGDIYQGLYFWHKASSLFIKTSKVATVMLENDAATGVDDVSVFYEGPGIDDNGRFCIADFCQIKYHVSQSDSYSAENLIDPAFINAKTSLLQKFKKAYEKLPSGQWYRLYLISNWMWQKDDDLAKAIRADGSLPDYFFTESSGSILGKIREKWRKHLAMTEETFADFAKRLRFGFNQLGRQDFEEWVNDRLGRANLKVPAADKRVNSYIALYVSFISAKTNSFTRESLQKICEQESLLTNTGQPNLDIIGIRSFMRFAENMEDETGSYICLSKYFNDRFVKDNTLWNASITPETVSFLESAVLRGKEYHILLDCHLSVSYLAGYTLNRKSGVSVFPVQKGTITTVWQPTDMCPPADWRITAEAREIDAKAPGLAVAISITRDVSDDVENYLKTSGLKVHTLLKLKPNGGPGQRCIISADHAVRLAELAMEEIQKCRRGTDPVHIFAAAPNGFVFFLGQFRGALRKVQLYEFDFEKARGGMYMPSISLPISA